MVLISLIISIHISSLVFYFPEHSPLILVPKMAENPELLSIMAAQGLENTIKAMVINLKRGPNTSGDDYILLLSFALFLSTYSPPFWPKID